MKKIIFDVMGNDNGMQNAIQSALNFIKVNLDYIIILVGNKEEISKYTYENERIEIVDAVKLQNKEISHRIINDNNSIITALKLLKNGEGDAVISCGDSAYYLAASTLILKRINNVNRSAFCPVLPTIVKNQKTLFLDAGANLKCTADTLVQWAKLASVFYKIIFDLQNPSISLLNIGKEDYKGIESINAAHQILKQDSNINYQGFIEPRNLLAGEADIIVTDGYAGNIALKTLEGTVLSLLKLLKNEIQKSYLAKVGALLAKKAFKNTKKILDYRNLGGAFVLGVNGLVVKVHGSANVTSYGSSLDQIKRALEKDIINILKGKQNGIE